MVKVNIRLDLAPLTKGLQRAKDVVAVSDNMATVEMANMYIDLCTEITEAIHTDPSTVSVAEQQLDNMDRTERHNSGGGHNRPSLVQEHYNKEYGDDSEEH